MASLNLDDVMPHVLDEMLGTKAEEVPPEEKEPDFDHESMEEEMKEMATDHRRYSELFGWNKSILGEKEEVMTSYKADGTEVSITVQRDFPVRVFEKEEWNEEGLYYIPEADPNREIDHSVMYPFVLGMQTDESGTYDKCMLVGPTGSGKSTLAEYYCAKVGQPFFRINGRQDMESDAIIGHPWVEDGKMHFELGEIPKAMKAGWFVLFDEPWKTPSGIWMTLQRAMERGGILQIDGMPGELADKQVVPDPRHRMVLADNVVGTGDNVDKYGATLIQDSSTLNRIDMVLNVDYLKESTEVKLLRKKFKGIGKERAEHMIRLLNLLRRGFDQGELSSPASLRNIEAWARKAIQVRNYAISFSWVLLNRYSDESEKQAVRGFYFDVFGERL